MRNTSQKLYPYQVLLLVVVGVSLFVGMISWRTVRSTYADVAHDPYGFADYCKLENNVTAIYGWANDPDAPAGVQPYVSVSVNGTTQTIASDRSGYRDTAINQYINQLYPGHATPGTYGWRAQFSGLYKGNSYALTGTNLNYLLGSNSVLAINTGQHVDNDTTKPYFANGKIPDSCLAVFTSPTPVTPPAPNPTPKPPAPKPNPSSAPAPSTNTPNSAATSPEAPTVIGTNGVVFRLAPQSATKIRLIYGSSKDNLNQSSPDTNASTDPTNIALDKLQAVFTYYYQIIRIDTKGAETRSSVGSFTTKGYTAVVSFTHNNGKKESGLKASILELNRVGETDNNGVVTFTDIPTGNYTLQYTYNYSDQTVILNMPTEPEAAVDPINPDITKVPFTVNLDIETAPTKPSKSAANLSTVIVGLIILAALIATGYWLFGKQRRRSRRYHRVSTPPPAAGPTPNAPHAGESLKDMVIASMRAEAERRRNNQPPT